MTFIPAPYVGHREVWRRAYVHIYDVLAKDTELVENLEATLANSDAPARPKIMQSRKGQRGVSAAEIYKRQDAEKAASDARKQALADPNRFKDPVCLLFKESLFSLPQDRIDAVRKLLLQNLYDGQLKSFYIANDVIEISDRGIWLGQGAAGYLRNGAILIDRRVGKPSKLIFDGPNVRNVFPPKKAKSVSHLPQKTGPKSKVDRIARTIGVLWPDGLAESGLFPREARLQIENYVDFTFGDDSYRKGRKLAEVKRNVDK